MQGDVGLIPGLGGSPGGGNSNPLQYSCLENLHGQRSLAGYSPWGHKESDMTERLIHSLSLSYDMCVYSLSRVRLFIIACIVAHQVPLSMGILQARKLDWVAILSSRGFSQPKDRTQVSCIAGGFFIAWATREAQEYWSG